MNNMVDMDLDVSFTITEVDEEEFMDYYIRIDKILQLEREFLDLEQKPERDAAQVDEKMQEEEEEIEYYAKMCEQDEPAYIGGYWR